MGIKGTVRRSTDGHIIHANIDTDVIIAEEPPYGRFFLITGTLSIDFWFALCRVEMLIVKYRIAEIDCMLLLSSTFQLFVLIYK